MIQNSLIKRLIQITQIRFSSEGIYVILSNLCNQSSLYTLRFFSETSKKINFEDLEEIAGLIKIFDE